MPTVSVNADRDSFTFSTWDGQVLNYGDATTMQIQNDFEGGEHFWCNRAYWGFTFSIPGPISSATMYVYQSYSSNNAYANATWYTCGTFSEMSITWNNQPGPGSNLGTFNQANGWVSAGVTGYIPTSGTQCFVGMSNPEVRSDGVGTVQYTTKEGGTSPYVSVTYNAIPTQPGAFTTPASGAVFPVGVAISVDWGDSSDADGTTPTYNLYYRLNGGGQTLIASAINGSSYSWTPPGAGSYVLDVYASDGTSLSPVRQSSTFLVGGIKKRMIVG